MSGFKSLSCNPRQSFFSVFIELLGIWENKGKSSDSLLFLEVPSSDVKIFCARLITDLGNPASFAT